MQTVSNGLGIFKIKPYAYWVSPDLPSDLGWSTEFFSSFKKEVDTDMKCPEIKDVIFNEPATIVFWKDGTKTVVVCNEGETFDKWYGIAMCHMKKLYGNGYKACKVCENWEDLKENKQHFEKISKYYGYKNSNLRVAYEFTKRFFKVFDEKNKTSYNKMNVPKLKDFMSLFERIRNSVLESKDNDYVTNAIMLMEQVANEALIESEKEN